MTSSLKDFIPEDHFFDIDNLTTTGLHVSFTDE